MTVCDEYATEAAKEKANAFSERNAVVVVDIVASKTTELAKCSPTQSYGYCKFT